LGKFTLIFQVKIDNRYKESYWLPNKMYMSYCRKNWIRSKRYRYLVCDFKNGV